jgi:hypothetical protein
MSRVLNLIVLAVILTAQGPGSAARRLTAEDANLLVTNIPVSLVVKRNGGCPTPDYSELGPDLAIVQLRNTCPRSGSGLIGNYVVDLHSGKIWSDIDRKNEVDSPHLRSLRNKLKSK